MITWTCPCGADLEAPDSFAGRTIRCPGCAAARQVPAPATSIAETPPETPPEPSIPVMLPDEDEANAAYALAETKEEPLPRYTPEPKRQGPKKSDLTRLRVTNFGLGLIAAGIVIVPLSVLLWVLATAVDTIVNVPPAAGTRTPRSTLPVREYTAIVILGLQFLSIVLFFLGQLVCCWVPARSQARGTVMLSLAMAGGAIGALFLIVGLAFQSRTEFYNTALFAQLFMAGAVLFSVMLFVSYLLLFRFLEKFAKYLGNESCAEMARGIFVIWLIAGTIGLFITIVLVVLAALVHVAGVLLLFIAAIAWFIFWMKQSFHVLDVIGQIREAIGVKTRPRDVW